MNRFKLTLCAIIAGFAIGCGGQVELPGHPSAMGTDKEKKEETIAITPDYYKQGIDKLVFETGEIEKITTQIYDVQDGFLEGNAGYSKNYKFVMVKGGDAEKGLVLIYPHSQYFEKFVPAEISFRRLKNSRMSSRDFAQKIITYKWHVMNALNYIIEADGIIEPDGVKYLDTDSKK